MEFLGRLQQGEPAAMNQFVKAELPKIYALLIRLTKNPTEAEDLAQESFIKAVRNLHRFKGEAKLSTWLYRIAVNTWKNRLRYQRRRHAAAHIPLAPMSPTNDEEFELPLPEKEPGPEEQYMRMERQKAIYAALERLDPDDRSIIHLRDVEGRTYEEISQILELNIGTVKSRLSRAREALREEHRKLEGKLV